MSRTTPDRIAGVEPARYKTYVAIYDEFEKYHPNPIKAGDFDAMSSALMSIDFDPSNMKSTLRTVVPEEVQRARAEEEAAKKAEAARKAQLSAEKKKKALEVTYAPTHTPRTRHAHATQHTPNAYGHTRRHPHAGGGR